MVCPLMGRDGHFIISCVSRHIILCQIITCPSRPSSRDYNGIGSVHSLVVRVSGCSIEGRCTGTHYSKRKTTLSIIWMLAEPDDI